MFVLKSGAGFSIFKWIALLASDFLEQALAGAIFFFDEDVVLNKHWFFVNTVSRAVLIRRSDLSDKFLAFVHYLLHRLCSDDVLLGSHGMAYQELVGVTIC